MIQSERALQAECALRLQKAPLDAVWLPIPNGIWVPARTIAERTLVARIIARMKADGMLVPGAPDWVVLWQDGCGCIEFKRPEQKLLLTKRRSGRPSKSQIQFEAWAQRRGVRYAICDSWPSLRDTLIGWGRLPLTWENAA